MAATLANGGINPLTQDKVFNKKHVRNALSIMLSCGMYDYSGEWMFKVGVPAKSGVSGGLMLVIPNLCGICIWSPPLDTIGNSVRGVALAERIVREFNLHNINFSRRNLQRSREEFIEVIMTITDQDVHHLMELKNKKCELFDID